MKINLTPGRIESFKADEGQSFLWDATAPGLGVRATPGGTKAFILQSRFAGKAIRITLGDVKAIPLAVARNEVRRLQVLIEQGIDPREKKRVTIAEQEEARATREKQEILSKVQNAPMLEAWEAYLVDRSPRWSARHLKDHRKLSQDGTVERRRGKGLRKPGPLHPLLVMGFGDLSPAVLEQWIKKEVQDRPTQTRLALRLFQGFLSWCGEHPLYQSAILPGLITKRVKEHLPKKNAKTDCLQKEQLVAWFAGVRQCGSPVVCAFLQSLLLTGARKEELASLRWEEVDFRWKSITIHDKVEGERTIPLTPFVESLLRFLPRYNEWVFSSPAAASGRIQEPFRAHKRALRVAGIEGLTLHGLRRSFATLSEWPETPVGIVAQIMGHKPSATAEKHYKKRPLDLLRMWHVKVEAWILKQAGLEQPGQEVGVPALRVLQGGVR